MSLLAWATLATFAVGAYLAGSTALAVLARDRELRRAEAEREDGR